MVRGDLKKVDEQQGMPRRRAADGNCLLCGAAHKAFVVSLAAAAPPGGVHVFAGVRASFGRRSRSGHHRRRAVGCIRRVPSDQSRAPKNLENLMQLGACQAPPCIHLAPTPLVGNPLATDVHRLDRGRRAELHSAAAKQASRKGRQKRPAKC